LDQQASARLTPDQILADVTPDDRLALLFSERLYSGAGREADRRKFLLASLQRLPHDRGIRAPEPLQFEAWAWAALDGREMVRARMEAALSLEPENLAWRKEFIEWLLRWGRIDVAHDQSKIGLYYATDSKLAREILKRTADALARRESVR
jgi:hypothetical protein